MAPPSNLRASHRRKIALACEPCRERKSRCDGGKPICSTCQRRSLDVYQCIYQTENARTASTNEYIASLHDRIRQLEDACAKASVSQMSPSQNQSLPDALNASPGRQEIVPAAASSGEADQQDEPQARLGGSSSHESNLVAPPSRITEPIRPMSSAGPPSEVTGMGAIATAIEDEESQDPASSKKFYGSSSAASLMQLAHQSIKSGSSSSPNTQKSTPPKLKTHGSGPEPLKTAHSASGCGTPSFPPVDYSLPSRAQGDYLLERYRMRTYYLYPFIHWPTFYEAYETLWVSTAPKRDTTSRLDIGLGSSPNAGTDSAAFHCALNAMFAIGCHFSDMAYSEQETLATKFFLRAKQYVNLDLIDSDNIGVVQALLIVAQLLQGTSYPSRCWNSVGMACRIAQGLGLHSNELGASGHPLEAEMRRRVWHGCVMMDTIVSMTFGRPTITSHLMAVPLPSPREDEQFLVPKQASLTSDDAPSKMRFYVEALKLYRILGKILVKMYQPWMAHSTPDTGETTERYRQSMNDIVSLESELTAFETALPSFLSWRQPRGALPTDARSDEMVYRMQTNVLHARFLYLKLMLLRPSFTEVCQEWISRTGNRGPDEHETSSQPTTTHGTSNLYSSLATECAISCVRAAIELQALIHETYATAATGAWWYDGFYASLAGMIVILARSCPLLLRSLNASDLDEAFGRCEDTLGRLASFSTSAHNALALIRHINQHLDSKQHAVPLEASARPNRQLHTFGPDENHAQLGGGEMEGITENPLGSSIADSSFFNWDSGFDFVPDDFGLGYISFSSAPGSRAEFELGQM